MKAWFIFYNTLILPSFLFSKNSDDAEQMKKYLLVYTVSINGKLHLANQITDYLYDISSVAPGYYIIGIVGVAINAGNNTTLVSFYILNKEIRLRVYNAGPNAVTPDSIIVALLYSKYKPGY